MRPGIVLTASGTVVAMAWAVAAAQENFFGRPVASFGPTAAAAADETAGDRPTAVPGVKNYYDELFGKATVVKQANPSALRMASGTADPAAAATQARFAVAGETVTGQQAAIDPGAIGNPFSDSESLPVETTSPLIPQAPPGGDAHVTVSNRPLPGPVADGASDHGATAPAADPMVPAMRDEAFSTNSGLPTIDMTTGPAATDRLAGMYVAGPAAVGVTWERHGEVIVGREHDCDLVVTNSGASAAEDVIVEAFFPPEVKLIGADPQPAQAGDHLTWTIPTLAAGAKQRIAITVLPAQQGDLQISAFVRFTEAAAATLTVREPQLKLEVTGPTEVPIGETVAHEVTISNPGTGTTDDVSVEITLPPGLEHAKGKTLVMPIGSLAAGQSQVIRVALYATAGGPQAIQVRAAGGPGLHQEATSTVVVAAPTLALETEGPSLRFVGREAVYKIRVINDGGAVANNVRVVHTIPSGFQFVRADKGGTYEPGTSEVVWYLGRLEPGQSAEFATELMAQSLGEHEHHVSAGSEGGAKAEATVATTVDGTASLVVEVLDLDDPVEVGSETAYEVRVRNEGTKPALNVEVACGVPEGVAALSARGPTAHKGDASQLAFAPIAELAPGKTALYRVIVKGTGPGKHRFRVRLTSESIDEPLVHEELTYFYAD